MGDKSPKANQKKSSQKQAVASLADQKNKQAAATKAAAAKSGSHPAVFPGVKPGKDNGTVRPAFTLFFHGDQTATGPGLETGRLLSPHRPAGPARSGIQVDDRSRHAGRHASSRHQEGILPPAERRDPAAARQECRPGNSPSLRRGLEIWAACVPLCGCYERFEGRNMRNCRCCSSCKARPWACGLCR